MKYRTAVPTTQVYVNKIFFSNFLIIRIICETNNTNYLYFFFQPHFIDIAEIWLKLQDEVIVLSYLNDVLYQLQNLFPEVSSHLNVIDNSQ